MPGRDVRQLGQTPGSHRSPQSWTALVCDLAVAVTHGTRSVPRAAALGSQAERTLYDVHRGPVTTVTHGHVPGLALEPAPRTRVLPPKDSSPLAQRRGPPESVVSGMAVGPLCSETAPSLLTHIRLHAQGGLCGTRWLQR